VDLGAAVVRELLLHLGQIRLMISSTFRRQEGRMPSVDSTDQYRPRPSPFEAVSARAASRGSLAWISESPNVLMSPARGFLFRAARISFTISSMWSRRSSDPRGCARRSASARSNLVRRHHHLAPVRDVGRSSPQREVSGRPTSASMFAPNVVCIWVS